MQSTCVQLYVDAAASWAISLICHITNTVIVLVPYWYSTVITCDACNIWNGFQSRAGLEIAGEPTTLWLNNWYFCSITYCCLISFNGLKTAECLVRTIIMFIFTQSTRTKQCVSKIWTWNTMRTVQMQSWNSTFLEYCRMCEIIAIALGIISGLWLAWDHYK